MASISILETWGTNECNEGTVVDYIEAVTYSPDLADPPRSAQPHGPLMP